MEDNKESQMISAAAFVEGGFRTPVMMLAAYVLRIFVQVILQRSLIASMNFTYTAFSNGWCQRSAQCPMCWQSISLKDPTSQELFEAVEQERKLRAIPSRNATIFHHPAFSDFELQHLRMSINDSELQDRILQHLAVAAAMRRANQHGRRAGQRTRSSAHGHPQSLVLSNQTIAPALSPDSAAEEENDQTRIHNAIPSTPIKSERNEALQRILHVQTQSSSSASGSSITSRQRIYSNDRGSTTRASSVNEDRAEPSELQPHSDSLQSRLNAVSTRYKESFSKGARGWKERLFCRSCSMSELGSETRRREMNAEIASVSGLKESRECSENSKSVVGTSLSSHMEECSIQEVSNQNDVEASGETSSHDDNTSSACFPTSHLN
ncbi:hypothetical protein ACSQ67_001785 [Phaseolus vulgaris]